MTSINMCECFCSTETADWNIYTRCITTFAIETLLLMPPKSSKLFVWIKGPCWHLAKKKDKKKTLWSQSFSKQNVAWEILLRLRYTFKCCSVISKVGTHAHWAHLGKVTFQRQGYLIIIRGQGQLGHYPGRTQWLCSRRGGCEGPPFQPSHIHVMWSARH